MLAWRSSKDGLAGIKLGESRRNFLPWTDCDHNHQRVVGFMERFRGASARIKGSRHNVFCWNLLLSPSVPPNSLEHLLGSPLYLMSGAGAELLVHSGAGRTTPESRGSRWRALGRRARAAWAGAAGKRSPDGDTPSGHLRLAGQR